MADFNKVMLIGRLTRDPELRYTSGGTAVGELGLAVGRKYRDRNSNEMREETCYVDITAWGKLGEICCQYLAKGRPVFVEGRLQFDQWENKEGQKRSKLRVVADNVQFLDSRGDSGGGGGGGGRGGGGEGGGPRRGNAPQGDAPAGDGGVDEDVPF